MNPQQLKNDYNYHLCRYMNVDTLIHQYFSDAENVCILRPLLDGSREIESL